MRWAKYYLPTYKETPSDAEIASHRLMLRAGMIKKLTSGVYTFLPTGFRVLKKIEAIVREEMDRAGAQEILMPILHPGELYEETGRLENFGDLLFKLRDRRQRFFALGPTHEEVVTDLGRSALNSYRQLPQIHYQINTKFRDEFRPRFGLMRAREFIMKDAYSFHASDESLQETYEVMAKAYQRILERCGLDSVMVQADAGAIGGDVNHEFVVLAESGESEIFRCPQCGYAANDERAESGGADLTEMEPVLDAPEKVDTPGQTTIDEVTAFLGVAASRLAKTLLYNSDSGPIAALVPGERSVSDAKLARVLKDPNVTMMTDKDVEELTGAKVGYAGPVGLPANVRIVTDTLLEAYDGMVVGANATDTHFRGVKMGRDFTPELVSSISIAQAGDACLDCDNGKLELHRGVELGHIFKLDTKYSESMKATFLDADGQEKYFIMGCYGFGVSRAVAAAIEQHNDDKGIRWPRAIAPFQVIVLPVKLSDEEVMKTAEDIYGELGDAGIETLFDDRELRAGVKFKDAELIGIPVRVTIGERNLKDGNVEIYYREDDRSEIVPVADAIKTVQAYYA